MTTYELGAVDRATDDALHRNDAAKAGRVNQQRPSRSGAGGSER